MNTINMKEVREYYNKYLSVYEGIPIDRLLGTVVGLRQSEAEYEVYKKDLIGFGIVLKHIDHASFPDEFIMYQFTYTVIEFIMCTVCSEIEEAKVQ